MPDWMHWPWTGQTLRKKQKKEMLHFMNTITRTLTLLNFYLNLFNPMRINKLNTRFYKQNQEKILRIFSFFPILRKNSGHLSDQSVNRCWKWMGRRRMEKSIRSCMEIIWLSAWLEVHTLNWMHRTNLKIKMHHLMKDYN